MTLADIRELVLAADPDACAYESDSTGEDYTTWQPLWPMNLLVDNRYADGWHFVIDRFTRMQDDPITANIRAMLLAGAEEVKRAWKETAERHGYRETGDMIESIRADKAPKSDANDVRRISVYPRGEDRKGVRNAEKAYVLHYGTSKIHGSHWVDEADQDAGPMVQDVFEKIWDRHLKGG